MKAMKVIQRAMMCSRYCLLEIKTFGASSATVARHFLRSGSTTRCDVTLKIQRTLVHVPHDSAEITGNLESGIYQGKSMKVSAKYTNMAKIQ